MMMPMSSYTATTTLPISFIVMTPKYLEVISLIKQQSELTVAIEIINTECPGQLLLQSPVQES